MRRRNILLLGIWLLLLLMTGCGSGQGPAQEESDREDGQIQIGMSFDSFLIERWQRDRDIFVSTAKEQGAEVNVQNANGDIEEQIAQIRYLIQKKVDVIVIICIDSDGLSDVVAEAKAEGIRVIAYDRLIKNANVDLYISFDNEKVGQLMGQTLASQGLPKGKVLILGGPTADNNVSMVEKGFTEEMKKNGIRIVDVMHADAWKAEYAADYIYENPEVLQQVDAIMCGNDNLATVTIRTLAEKRMAGKLLVVGQDADLEACQHIAEGTQLMTVYKPVDKLAKTAAEYAVRLARGESTDCKNEIDDGTFAIPCLYLQPVAVTKSNLDETIINSGFHLREEVYMNIR